ncbi:hypothetical protein GTY85_16465 [Streptomyces sp. SID8377]|nr:hypothetical protein [Streptomyces sp. SID8377]
MDDGAAAHVDTDVAGVVEVHGQGARAHPRHGDARQEPSRHCSCEMRGMPTPAAHQAARVGAEQP